MTLHLSFRSAALGLATSLCLGAPLAHAASTTATATGKAATADGAAAVAPMTDGQIASLMMAANQAEIDEAKMAKSKAQSKAVKDFAEHMMSEHTKNESEGKNLAKKVGVKPDSHFAALDDMKKEASLKAADLKKVKGFEFDKTYMANQIAMHEDLLMKLNDQLIPAAQNSQIKNYLEETKAHVQAHLDLAKSVQSGITAQ